MGRIEKEWQKDDMTSFADIIFEYIRYWKWFILSIIICLIIGLVVVMTTQRQYKATLSVLLKEDSGSNKSGSAGLSLDELGLLSTTNNLDNEIAILSSPDLMRQVVDSMNLQTTYYVRDRFKKNEIYSRIPFQISYNNKIGELSGNIELSVAKTASGFSIEGKHIEGNGEETDISQNVKQLPVTISLPDSIGTIQIKLTGKEIKSKEKYYASIINTTRTVRNLCTSLSIMPTTKSSSVLNLNLTINNTDKGGAILKELIKQYNARNVRVNNEIAYNTAIFINERLKEIAIELGDVERDVVDYKQKNRITDLVSEAQMSIQQTGQNKERLMEIETQLNVISLVDRFVNDPANKDKIIPNLGVSDPALSEIITNYNNKILNSEVLLKSTGEENPMRMRVSEEIANMRNGISSSLLNVRKAYSISKQDMQRLSGSTQSRIQSIPLQEKGLLERVRQQQVKESLFLFLMQKREETNMAIASTSDKARIISSPQTGLPPVAPKSTVILFASLILGAIIPIMVIYIIKLFKTQISNRSTLEKLTNISIVGQIAKNTTNDKIVVQKDNNTGIAEMFRSLRNNLNFILKNKKNRMVLITSTVSKEGKTFISVNLAVSFALSKQKVLLIGADIRNPKLKNYIDSDKKIGLTDYLVDADDDWSKFISKSTLNPNLDIMISGAIPPNPNELLMTPKLKAFLSEVKNEYDVVILDTAPVGLVSDTYLIDQYIDATLYVVREGVTPKGAINFINMQKEENKLHNMYIVLNDSTLDKNYKYGYGRDYGYQQSK